MAMRISIEAMTGFLKYPSADEFPGAVLGRGVEAAACGYRMMNKEGLWMLIPSSGLTE